MARLAGAGVSPSGLIVAAGIAAVICAALAAVIGEQIAPILNSKGKLLITAIALALAGCEVLFLRASKAPAEPTLSVGATALVLGGALITGAAGLLVIAITLVTGEPILAGVGGAVGAAVALAVPAIAGAAWERNWPQAVMRWIIGMALLMGAIVIGVAIFVPFA